MPRISSSEYANLEKVNINLMVRLIPIGSWCRAAYQCRTQSNKLGLRKTVSTPFDWSITPFRSLTLILNSINNPEIMPSNLVLDPLSCSVNDVGSIRDEFTGISFHHDLGPDIIKPHIEISDSKKINHIPRSLANSTEWSKARARFFHTLKNFKEIFSEPEVVFVRWQKLGTHVNIEGFPEVFFGETSLDILSSLHRANMHPTSSLLTVETRVIANQSEKIKSPIIEFTKSQDKQMCHAILAERKGWNGDQTWNFRGDEASWSALFIKHMSEMGYDF